MLFKKMTWKKLLKPSIFPMLLILTLSPIVIFLSWITTSSINITFSEFIDFLTIFNPGLPNIYIYFFLLLTTITFIIFWRSNKQMKRIEKIQEISGFVFVLSIIYIMTKVYMFIYSIINNSNL